MRKLLAQLASGTTYLLYLLSCLVPRDPRRYAFIGWHIGHDMEIFADNCKYLFLHIAGTRPDLIPVWLAKDRRIARVLQERGYPAHYHRSLWGVWEALRAGTTVIDAYLQPENFRWTGRSRLIQLLHGKGMKKGGYQKPPPRRQDMIMSPSEFVSGLLPPSFVQDSLIVVTGYPRSDVLFREIPGSNIGVDSKTLEVLKSGRYQKRILYAPTFRRGQKTLDVEQSLGLTRLSEWLVSQNHLFLLSLHPKYRDQARALTYQNVHFVEESDAQPLLPHLDLIITDYSSIFTDYLLLDRPIVFYAYDLEEYTKNEGLSFDNYDDYTPGVKAYTPEELLTRIKEALTNDTFVSERARVRALYHAYTDGDSSERVMRALEASTKSRS